ncbi:unnamed protein product [Paramecium sonneborni]|uniref:Protein kinase domain-containing protein n=1 Tax=Paramecium sonneborni TaxID=65129 RepID=A0A8S1M6N6_9CILI|nr:unnamed protein product [Paramecium sonneborni]
MQTFNLIIPKFMSYSGEFFLMEEQYQDKIDRYFALKLSSKYKKEYLFEEFEKKDQFQQLRLFRHYVKMIDNNNNNQYYLFRYVQGNTLQELIDKHRSQVNSIDQKTINIYFTQLLEALYELHKLNILGRIFSVENILENNGNLILMDFGLGPEIQQNHLNILAPPELIKNFDNQNMDILFQHGLKVDSWLLGAFLYHLVKLRPITSIEDINQPKKMIILLDVNRYCDHIKEKRKIYQNINIQSQIHNQDLINLINGLLTYDVQKRMSFLDIYQSDYVKNLNLQQYQKFFEFYRQFNETQIQESLRIRMGISSSILINTQIIEQHKKNEQNLQQQREVNNPQKTPSNDSGISEGKLVELPYMASQIQDSIYYEIWKEINMEQFLYFILNDTADQINQEYPQEYYKLSRIVQYILKKLSFLVLQDFFAKLKSTHYPWKENKKQEWTNFQQEYKFQFLKHSIIGTMNKLIESMKKIQEELEKNKNQIFSYLNQNNYEPQLIKEVEFIIQEKKNFNQNNNVSQFNIFSDQYKQDDWSKRYKVIIIDLYQYFQKKKDIERFNYKQKYSQIQLKILFCMLIDKLFSLENINKKFKNIKPKDNKKINPDDIYCFIQSKDNYELQYEEIEYQVKINFPNEFQQ